MTAASSRDLSGALVLLLVISMGATGAALPWWQEVLLDAGQTVSAVACNTASMLAWFPAACVPSLFSDIEDGDADVVHSDIYTKALSTADAREQHLRETRSHLNQSYGISLAKGKLAVIRGLNNNSTSSAEALSNGITKVEDFYATQQLRTISYLNRELMKWNQTIQTVQDHSGLNLQDITTTELCSGGSAAVVPEFTENNVTLANGTVVTQYGFIWDATDGNDGGNCRHHVIVPRDITADTTMSWTNSGTGTTYTYEARPLNITDPTGNDTIAHMVGGPAYVETWDKINRSYQRARENLVGLHDELYATYEAGDLTIPQGLGPLESLVTASTNYQDTGYYSYKALSLAQVGLATNSSYAFEVRWQQANSTDTHRDVGQLFIADQNTTTLEVNVTYDAAQLGAWLVHTPDNRTRAVETPLNGTFTILSMVDKSSGEQINQTAVQETRFYTASTSDLQQQLNRQDRLLEQLLQQQQTGIIEGIQGWLPDWLPAWATSKTAVIAGGLVLAYGGLRVIAR